MTTTSTAGTPYTFMVRPTKKDIIQRLFIAGQISFDEMWTLLQDNEGGISYIPMPYTPPYAVPFPLLPELPVNICKNDN
jgi:hypothetical protein